MLTITDISVTADGNIQKSIYLEMNFSNGSNLSHYELQYKWRKKTTFLTVPPFLGFHWLLVSNELHHCSRHNIFTFTFYILIFASIL